MDGHAGEQLGGLLKKLKDPASGRGALFRIAYEFKVSPKEVLGWPARLFDEACAYIGMMDAEAQDARNKAKAGSSPQFMGGNRRRR